QAATRRVCDPPPPLARRELAALIGQPMEALNHVDRFPGFAAAEQSGREAHRMKGHVVLAQKLQVLHVLGLPPPASPIAFGWLGVRPFLRCRNVSDWRVEPDIEDLAFESGTRHRHPQALSRVMPR